MKNRNLYKSWTLGVCCSIIALVGMVATINVIVDAYGILRTDFSRQFQVPNMNIAKMSFLLNNRTKFDSFVFGSSRVENIDQSKIPGGKFYNMTAPLALPEEHLANLKFLLASGIPVKNVVVGLDDFSCLADPEQRRSNLELQLHPAVSGKKLEVFYSEYFLKLRSFTSQLAEYIRHNYTKQDNIDQTRFIYDIQGTGRLFCRDCDANIERDRKKHMISPVFARPVIRLGGDNMAKALDAIASLKDLARKQNFHLVFFINPLHETTYLDADLDKFFAFKRALANITDYYDFSGLNSITTDNYYYYEPSHYRPSLGDKILKVMFGTPQVEVPRDFGVLVTRENVEAHLSEQCRELQRPGLAMSAANAEFARTCSRMDYPKQAQLDLSPSARH